MRHAAAAVALAIVACRQGAPYEPPADAGHPAQAVASTVPPSPPEPEVDAVIGLALFDKRERLAVCFDVDARDQRPADAGPWTATARQRAVDQINAADAAAAMPGMTDMAMAIPCEQAFADRLLLATCTSGQGTARYYSFDLLATDAEMRDCVKALHGSWHALARDSKEYRLAKVRWDIERSSGDLEKLQGH